MNTENIIPVNNEALSRALVAVVGEETAAVIVKSYQEIDKAMAAGHMAGFKEGYKAAEAEADTQAGEAAAQERFLYDEAYREGHEFGFQEAVDKIGFEPAEDEAYAKGFQDGAESSAYDDGYIDGVSDARMCPSDADARVAELCRDDNWFDEEVDDYDDQADLGGFDGTYETDGDYYTRQYAEQEAERAERCGTCGSRDAEAFCNYCR